MNITDHIAIIWPSRTFSKINGRIVFDDGLPMPTQAQLDVTRAEALTLFEKSAMQVSMTAIRLALIDAGLYESVTAAIDGHSDATERLRTQTWWATAQTIRRDHPLVATLAARLGKTQEEIDAIFATAASFE